MPPALPRVSGSLFLALSGSGIPSVAISTIIFANWFGSRGRFGMVPLSCPALTGATGPDFKLRHYPSLASARSCFGRMTAIPEVWGEDASNVRKATGKPTIHRERLSNAVSLLVNAKTSVGNCNCSHLVSIDSDSVCTGEFRKQRNPRCRRSAINFSEAGDSCKRCGSDHPSLRRGSVDSLSLCRCGGTASLLPRGLATSGSEEGADRYPWCTPKETWKAYRIDIGDTAYFDFTFSPELLDDERGKPLRVVVDSWVSEAAMRGTDKPDKRLTSPTVDCP